VTEDELVEVDLQVLGGGPAVSALKPSLEIREGAMCTREDDLAFLGAPALGDGRWS
jgi:hypothetical protein